MKKSLFLVAAVMAVAALSYCASAVGSAVVSAYGLALRAADQLIGAFVGFTAKFRTDDATRRTAVTFVQVRAFVARIVKRERPVVSASWRMCPSI
ncbi:MAG: hypothetical protein JWQ72_2976 [Polaromonas sp.]|nr:hypothetical protein [Polaromonas sp.]